MTSKLSCRVSTAASVLSLLACGGAGAPEAPPLPAIDEGCELHVWLAPNPDNDKDVPVRAEPSRDAPKVGRLPGDAEFVRLVVDTVRGDFVHYTSAEVVVPAEGGQKRLPPAVRTGWIPRARIDLDGQWASSEEGDYPPTLFERPSLTSEVAAVHDAPCGAVTTCGFAVDEVLGCAGRWARVRTEHQSTGWLHFDHQCDHRLTSCASKEAEEVPRVLKPRK